MEHKTNAVEVSFLKKTKWTGTTTRTLTFPVGELADRCLNAWLDITDESFSHATLPSTQLTERFSTLMKSDADQAAWDEFYKAVGEEFSRLSVDELAAFFMIFWRGYPTSCGWGGIAFLFSIICYTYSSY